LTSGAPISTNTLSPGSSSIRTAVDPPSRPSGIITVSRPGDAAARCARAAPTRTCGTMGSTGKPSPSSVTRPPSIAQSGRTEVTRPTSALAVFAFVVFQLDVPVEVVAPGVRGVAQSNRDADGGRLVRTFRSANEMHAGLRGSAAALAAVAGDAAGNDVLPIFSAALGDRHDMIEGQLGAQELRRAILTRVLVARVDVRARERHVVDP